jgi:hypothetical protein
VINNKEKETLYVNEPKGDKPTDSGSSHKKRDEKKKRCINKIIYYDSDTSSSSPRDDDDEDSLSKKKRLIRITLLIILASFIIQMLIFYLFHSETPPHFDGEDYSFWSHKMRSYLFSLHPSIWEIVENGMYFDNTDNSVLINEKYIKMPKLLLFC